MKRRGKDPNADSWVRPVERIELSENHVKLRIIIAVVLLIIGVSLIAYSAGRFFKQSDGWREITVDTSAGLNCGNDLVFQYYLGQAGISATAEYKAIAAEYTDACEKVYKLFDCANEYKGITNMYYINDHPNTEIRVDDVLYKAFEILESHGSRVLYGAPMYTEYKNLFFSETDEESAEFDALRTPALREYFAVLANYVNDPDGVDIRLLGNNKVLLYVSDEYINFAKENSIKTYADFFWTKNAFIVDYIAERMIRKGYTFGNISSYDGFIRNLDKNENEYSFNIIDMNGGSKYVAARMDYRGRASIVYLRNYPLSEIDDSHYYILDNGDIRHPYVDIRDGICKSSLYNLVSFSKDRGCAETLLGIIPVYISDSFDVSELEKLEKRGIYSLYCFEKVIYYNSDILKISDIYSKGYIKYTVKKFSENK